MKTRQLFDTTLYSEDHEVAITVVSVPTERLPDRRIASSPGSVLSALRLRPVAEVPPSHMTDALTAILATTDAEEAAKWLSEPPDPVPVELGEDVDPYGGAWVYDIAEALPPPRGIDSPYADKAGPYVERAKPRRTIPKDDPRADELREFARDAASDAIVPFQRSPVDLFQLPDLLQVGEATRVFVTTVRTNPILLVWVGGGFLVMSAVRGAGRALSGGLQYRLLRLFGLPDDIIREEMSRRRR